MTELKYLRGILAAAFICCLIMASCHKNAWRPPPPQNPMTEGDSLIRGGKRDEAKKAYLDFCRLSPDDGRPLAALGRMALEEENYDEAAGYLESAYRLTPTDFSLLSDLGRAYNGAGKPEKALKDFDRVIENEPLNYFALSGKARSQVMLGMYKEAEGTVGYTLNTVGERPEILILSSEIKEKKGDFKGAEEDLKKAVSMSSGSEENRKALAGFYIRLKQYDKARDVLKSLEKKNAVDRDLLIMMGDLELEAKKFRDSENAYLEAARLEPDDPDNFMNMGNLYFVQGDYEKALDEYRKASKFDPEAPYTFGGIGDCLMVLGRFTEAEAAYKKAISLDKNSEQDYVSLGDLYLKQGDLKKAEAQYRLAEKIRRTGEVLYALARLEARKGEAGQALAYIEKALAEDPELKESAVCEPYFKPLAGNEKFKKLVGAWRPGRPPEFRFPR